MTDRNIKKVVEQETVEKENATFFLTMRETA
jgi:hypothetical protein